MKNKYTIQQGVSPEDSDDLTKVPLYVDSIDNEYKKLYNRLAEYLTNVHYVERFNGKALTIYKYKKRPLVKITAKKGAPILLYSMEDEVLRLIKALARNYNVKIKEKDYEIAIINESAYAIALRIIGMGIMRIERDVQILKERRKEANKECKALTRNYAKRGEEKPNQKQSGGKQRLEERTKRAIEEIVPKTSFPGEIEAQRLVVNAIEQIDSASLSEKIAETLTAGSKAVTIEKPINSNVAVGTNNKIIIELKILQNKNNLNS